MQKLLKLREFQRLRRTEGIIMEFESYKEPLKNPNDMEEGPVKQAYISWREQRTRCYNKKRAKYKNYGAKGIEVKYSSRDFIGWWLENIKSFSGENPTVSRIDHNGHYEFGNIKIESRSENSQERNQRVGPFRNLRTVNVFDKDLNFVETINGLCEVAKKYGVTPQNVYDQCAERWKCKKTEFIFKYAEAA